MNANDGPLFATSSTGTPNSLDNDPKNEKMTKPPNTLVAQLPIDTLIESL